MGPLALHIVLLVVIDLTEIESVVFKQTMITGRGKKSNNKQADTPKDSYDKRLGEKCEENEQCQHYAHFASCTPSGDVSVCTCLPGFAREIADPTKCVAAMLEVSGNMLLTDIPWDDDMLVEGSEAFNSTTELVANLLLDIEEIVEITDIYIIKNISGPEVHYDVLILNEEAEPPGGLKRWTVLTKEERVDYMLERKRLPETIKESMMYKINEMAYFRGIDIHIISTDIITGKLGSFCIGNSDCTTPWSSCMDSTCSCTQGPIKILGDELYCG